MNWTKILIAGLAAGIAMNLADFVMHGFILGSTYTEYPVFTSEQANPLWFLLISVLIALFAAILFSKTRECWAPGVAGGATFGFWLGMVAFFSEFYNPLVLEGFPYFLAWCWGGTSLITGVVGGAVLGAVLKRA